MRTLLVDGNNCLSRSVHAAQGVAMSVDGVNTGALVIFVNLLAKYVKMTEPSHVAVMWDAGHALRDAAYPGYKAKRLKAEPGAEDSVPFAQAKQFLTWAGVPHKAMVGYEADDLIAATARQVTGEVVILSGDRDLLQLVGPEVVQYRLPDDEPWDEARVLDLLGYRPESIPLAKALIGDPGDGVPGLRGIGPKKAVALLDQAGWDWDALLGLLGPEKAAEAVLMRSLVDLRYFRYDATFLAANAGVPQFLPTRDGTLLWSALVEFCERYRLSGVLDRLRQGTLWAAEQSLVQPTDAALFEGIL